MEFDLSQEQRMLQETAERFLSDQADLERVRKIAERGEAMDGDLYHGLVGLGLTSIVIPEVHGGMGLGLLEAALVQEALGGAVAPVPFTGAAVLAPLGFMHAGSEGQKAEWLPKIVSGQAIFGVGGFDPAIGAREGAGVTFENNGLTGMTLFVIDGGAATHYLVADSRGRLNIVEAGASGLERTVLRTIDRTRSVVELRFGNTPCEPLAMEEVSGDAAGTMIDAGRVLYAADTLGAAQTMLKKAVAYALERKQFNRLIGSFQAVKHLCAEMAAQIEPARSLVWYAAYAHNEVPQDARLTSLHAKAHLSEVGRFVARTATEVHGGMGFTDLLGLHYWFKRIGANRQLLGGPEFLREEAARLQGWVA